MSCPSSRHTSVPQLGRAHPLHIGKSVRPRPGRPARDLLSLHFSQLPPTTKLSRPGRLIHQAPTNTLSVELHSVTNTPISFTGHDSTTSTTSTSTTTTFALVLADGAAWLEKVTDDFELTPTTTSTTAANANTASSARKNARRRGKRDNVDNTGNRDDSSDDYSNDNYSDSNDDNMSDGEEKDDDEKVEQHEQRGNEEHDDDDDDDDDDPDPWMIQAAASPDSPLTPSDNVSDDRVITTDATAPVATDESAPNGHGPSTTTATRDGAGDDEGDAGDDASAGSSSDDSDDSDSDSDSDSADYTDRSSDED